MKNFFLLLVVLFGLNAHAEQGAFTPAQLDDTNSSKDIFLPNIYIWSDDSIWAPTIEGHIENSDFIMLEPTQRPILNIKEPQSLQTQSLLTPKDRPPTAPEFRLHRVLTLKQTLDTDDDASSTGGLVLSVDLLDWRAPDRLFFEIAATKGVSSGLSMSMPKFKFSLKFKL